MKIIIAEFKHETNSFVNGYTDINAFRSRNLIFGDNIPDYFKGYKNEIGGFIEVLSKRNDIDIIPSVAANACPGGIVCEDVYVLVRDKLLGAIHANPDLDGILISFHGAMVSTRSEDCEGDLLEEIRHITGNEKPICVSLDFHANVTQKMMKHATLMFPFDHYPHTDMHERGMEAAEALLRILDGRLAPVKVVKKLPILYPYLETRQQPYKRFLDAVSEYECDPRVVSASIVAGFAYSDIGESGMSVIVQTNGDESLAEQIALELADMVYRDRHLLNKTYMDVQSAVFSAMKNDGVAVLADVADNPGNGGPGDGTSILHELIDRDAKNVIFATIYDPEAVQLSVKAGVGSMIKVRLGGKSDPRVGLPVVADAYVKLVGDGEFRNKGVMSHGVMNHLGITVVLIIGGIQIIVTSKRYQPWDPEVFRAHGIEPADASIIVLKSSVHYRAAFGALADQIIEVDAPNICALDLKRLPYKNIKRPIYPLD